MTAPTTITVTGTWYNADGTLAAGSVTFTPKGYGPNNANVVDSKPITATLASGAISQTLVNLSAGYHVTENITGTAGAVSYDIAGTAGLDLSTATRAAQGVFAPTSGAGAFASSVTATAAHGLGFTPDINRIRITPKALPAGLWYLSAVDGTNITVTCATSGSWAFAWSYV